MIERFPKILDIPVKLRPMIGPDFNRYRYFLLEGGRGGGKSQAVSRFLSFLASKYQLRIVCGREIQNSIAESVYSLMVDIIRHFQLNFEVFSTKIVHNETKSAINFRGFREQGAFNIQGMEGVDIVWIDEAQAITKETLDVLIPTIRKDKAKIFFSMNRHVHDDPVFEFCRDRKDCLHIHLNYYDNPFCTQALKTEAEECRKKSESDYLHIWEGQPLAASEDAVFGHEELWSCKRIDFALRDGYGLKIGGFDIARFGDDKCAVVGLMQMGALNWEAYYVDQWDKKDLNYTTGRILQETNDQNFEKCIIDEDGIGAGPLDTLNKGRGDERFVGFRNPPISAKDNKFFANERTANVYKVKGMIEKGRLKITDEELLKELEHAFRYTFDNYQRKILLSKDKMKKEGVASPNKADALIMAVSLIGTINYKQQAQYRKAPAYSPETNILEGAGIR